LKRRIIYERGQALVIIALAAVVLFGFTALAIDGSAKFSDRRHAQNAADTAAIAGALSLVNDETGACGTLEEWQCKALLRAEDNGYDDLTNNEVWVFQCDAALADRDSAPMDCGPYEGDPDYLTVIIHSTINTTFARVLGFTEMQNLVQAVTFVQKRGPAFDGFAFVQYKPGGSGCPGEFIVAGSGTVTVDGGGIFVNSNNTGGGSCAAFTQNGCNTTLDVINGGAITTVGEIALDANCASNMNSPSMIEGAEPFTFPPDIVLDPPPECDDAGYRPAQNDTVNRISYLYPGKYDTLPPSDATENKIYLMPGNYCVYDIVRVTNSTRLMEGHDVFLYIRYSSKPAPLSIQGGTMIMDAPDSGDYQGYLFYVEPPPIVGGTYSGSSKSCTINGGADDAFTGSIFAPYCDFTINGGGNPDGFHAQLIAYTITLSGNNDLYFLYDDSELAINQPYLGLMR